MSGSRWSATRSVIATMLLLLFAGTSGCGGSGARDDLAQSLKETQAAVRSVETALDQLDRGHTTRAAARVTAEDMADQIGTAQQRIVTTSTETDAERELRERCQQVIAAALVAVLDAEDDLTASTVAVSTRAQLRAADRDVTSATTLVGQR